jgi:hypothetical protein
MPAPEQTTANPVLTPPLVPQVVQPLSDSARTEAMLVAMSARRTVEAGKSLGDLLPRLQGAFGESSPTALREILAADKEPLTVAQLLRDFDAVAPLLQKPATWNFRELQKELSTLFVVRRSGTPPPAEDAQLQIARDYVVTGNFAAALRLVSAMPGAANAQDWIAKARRYIERQKALDTLEQTALTLPTAQPTQPDATSGPQSGAPPGEPAKPQPPASI